MTNGDSGKRFIPSITPDMYKSVSEQRRAVLEQEVNAGIFKDGKTGSVRESGLTNAGNVVGTGSGIRKRAQLLTTSPEGGGVSGSRGGGGTVRQIPGVYSPLWLNTNLNLPRDRATMNSWCRSFFALNPVVANAITLHSTYPISKLNIKCPNKDIEKFFNDMIEEIDLMNACVQIAQEYWLLGEAFVFAELDQTSAKWSRLVIQNGDYMVVKKTAIASEPLIMMRPDADLRRIVFSNRPSDIDQRKSLNETIIAHVKRGENIPLDNFYTSHLARKISPYEVRGTGLPVSCFRSLMIWDILREQKFVQAESMVNPLTIVKVGGEGPDALHPTAPDLEEWRRVFEEAEMDSNFKIITHAGLTVERVGWNQGVLDITNDIAQFMKETYIGLMIPQVIIEGGGDITYANGGISLDVLKGRYLQFRNMMGNWLKKKIFAPISKLNDFYEYKGGTKQLIIPEIEWNHMSMFETSDYVNVLVQLSQTQDKKVSQQTLYRSLGLDYEDERRKIRKEDIQESIRKKEMMSLERMALNELRALGDDDEIPEIAETPLPGLASPYADQGGGAPGGGGGPGGEMGLGGGLGGGLPPLPSGGPGLGGMEMAPPPAGEPGGGGGPGGPPPSAPPK